MFAILHRIFGDAVECELLTKNPVRPEGRPGDWRQPLKSGDLTKLRQAAGADLLAFLLTDRLFRFSRLLIGSFLQRAGSGRDTLPGKNRQSLKRHRNLVQFLF
jgi:hypothetical protein